MLVAFANATHIFSAKILAYMPYLIFDQSFNDTLTNDIVSFEHWARYFCLKNRSYLELWQALIMKATLTPGEYTLTFKVKIHMEGHIHECIEFHMYVCMYVSRFLRLPGNRIT